ncbi:MAG: hypothetical protein A4E63_00974 [Syntrophorhabdus sp. PtaU1.Bin050]|nr:MAG: hypothetical protein A4E63_00974 [Syntrophorhabdus sp. PtaU1.Bin050]
MRPCRKRLYCCIDSPLSIGSFSRWNVGENLTRVRVQIVVNLSVQRIDPFPVDIHFVFS